MGRPKKTAASTGKTAGLLGLRDLVSEINPLWSVILKRLQKSSRTYGFARIETPIVEDVGLYEHYYKNSVNPTQNTTPLVLGGKPSVIRSSILPSVLRNYIDYKVFETVPPTRQWVNGSIVAPL
jgi:histidyl-tRNA synthetase